MKILITFLIINLLFLAQASARCSRAYSSEELAIETLNRFFEGDVRDCEDYGPLSGAGHFSEDILRKICIDSDGREVYVGLMRVYEGLCSIAGEDVYMAMIKVNPVRGSGAVLAAPFEAGTDVEVLPRW